MPPPDGPQYFILVFDTQEQAKAWFGREVELQALALPGVEESK